jgi:transposase
VVDHTGELVADYTLSHTAAGLAAMLRRFAEHGVERVAIERPDGPVVEALLDGGFTVFVIHPRQMKNLRGRYGNAGNKDDVLDAFVLADVLRTDHRRLHPLERDTDPTRALRALTRARKDLVDARVALGNQLLANLQLVLPGAVCLFAKLDSPISIAWLRRFTTQQQADWLSPKRFDAWLKANSYCGHKTGTKLHAHLQAAPRGLDGVEAAARAAITLALIDAIEQLNTRIAGLDRQIREALELHPDAHIFTSLPKGGMVRAARCWPRSVMPEDGSAPMTPWPHWPAAHPRPAGPEGCTR